jgi:hypothetical protein
LKIYGKEGVRLRLEAHADKMQYFLRPLGQPFLTLGQLCESAMIAPLGDVLRTAWGKVLIRESVNVEGLCSRDADLLRFGAYGGYWTDLNRDNPELFKKKRRRFLQLQNQHRTTDRHGMIHLLTTEKWQQLLAS